MTKTASKWGNKMTKIVFTRKQILSCEWNSVCFLKNKSENGDSLQVIEGGVLTSSYLPFRLQLSLPPSLSSLLPYTTAAHVHVYSRGKPEEDLLHSQWPAPILVHASKLGFACSHLPAVVWARWKCQVHLLVGAFLSGNSCSPWACVGFYRNLGFLIQTKSLDISLIGNFKLSLGVDECEWLFVSTLPIHGLWVWPLHQPWQSADTWEFFKQQDDGAAKTCRTQRNNLRKTWDQNNKD